MKVVLDVLEVELEAFVSHLMDTGNGTPILSVTKISMFFFIREQWFQSQTLNRLMNSFENKYCKTVK